MQASAKRKYRPKVDFTMPKKSGSKKGSDEKPWPASKVSKAEQNYYHQEFKGFAFRMPAATKTPKDAKKKKKGNGSPPAKKAKVTAAGSEAEAESDDSLEEEEASIQWSVYEEESPEEHLPVEKPNKKTGKRAVKQTVQKKRAARSTAAPSVQAAGVREAEAVPDVHTEAATEDTPLHKREIGGEQDIPSPMRRLFEEESASRRPGKEPMKNKDLPECYYNETEDSFYIKRNTKFRCIPDMQSCETPFYVSSIFLHPEDENKLMTSSLKELSFLQAQMCMGATQISKYVTEQLQYSEKDKKKLYKDNASVTAFYEREKKNNNELRDRIKALEAQAEQDRVNFEKTLADKNKELQQFKADKDAAVEQLKEEQKESARKEEISRNTIEGLKATAQRLSSLSGSMSKEDIIAEYTRSEEYGSSMKDFSEHGYNILKRYLERNQLLSKDQLSKIDFEDCIEEASDEESDNL